jgi:hypothetical protein
MDAILHSERPRRGARRIHVLGCPLEDLPDGAMVAVGTDAFVVASGNPFLWSADLYRRVDTLPNVDGLITPPSTLAALRAGYRPALHPSIEPIRKERNERSVRQHGNP